jgi:hypothetical protein
VWRTIWNTDGLPKINIFCWIIAQGKLLMGENSSKRGFQGSFRCALCLKILETSQHLFLEYEFSIQVWKLVYLELYHKIVWPTNIKTLLESGDPSIRALSRVSWCFKEHGRHPQKICGGNFGLPETKPFLKISTPLIGL